MADREFFTDHNVLVNLDPWARGARGVAPCLDYFYRSRVRYAVTEMLAISKARLIDFWTNISYDDTTSPPVIRTIVGGQHLAFSASDICRILHLGTPEQENGPTCYSPNFIAGALIRIGYAGPSPGEYFHKGFVFGQWRFMFHVLAATFGSIKGNSDELSRELVSAMLSLVYNKPYSFSEYLFTEIRKQITADSDTRFMLYPRFCMILIRQCLPTLPAMPNDFSVDKIGSRVYTKMFQVSAFQNINFLPLKSLFGHLIHPDYVAPPDDDYLDDDAFEYIYTTEEESDIEDAEPLLLTNSPGHVQSDDD